MILYPSITFRAQLPTLTPNSTPQKYHIIGVYPNENVGIVHVILRVNGSNTSIIRIKFYASVIWGREVTSFTSGSLHNV